MLDPLSVELVLLFRKELASTVVSSRGTSQRWLPVAPLKDGYLCGAAVQIYLFPSLDVVHDVLHVSHHEFAQLVQHAQFYSGSCLKLLLNASMELLYPSYRIFCLIGPGAFAFDSTHRHVLEESF